MTNYFDLSLSSSHLHPLQGENCESSLRLLRIRLDKDFNGIFGFGRVNLNPVNKYVEYSQQSRRLNNITHIIPANTNAVKMLVQRRRQWANIKTTLVIRLVFAGIRQ